MGKKSGMSIRLKFSSSLGDRPAASVHEGIVSRVGYQLIRSLFERPGYWFWFKFGLMSATAEVMTA